MSTVALTLLIVGIPKMNNKYDLASKTPTVCKGKERDKTKLLFMMQR
jgi:hypothetical protein